MKSTGSRTSSRVSKSSGITTNATTISGMSNISDMNKTSKTSKKSNGTISSNSSVSSTPSSTLSKSAQKREQRKGKEIITQVRREDIKKYDTRRFTWEDIHDLDAGVAFELVYGFEPNVNYTNEYNVDINAMNARTWWERSAIKSQCGNTVGEFKQGSTCYICGFPIMTTPECEHILPIFKASLYLTLYRNDYKRIMDQGFEGKLTDPEERRIFNEIKMEYDWSHRCCNQKKNDIDFIKYEYNNRTNRGEFKLDFKTTQSLLKEIVDVNLNGGDGHCEDKSLQKSFFSKIGREKNTKKISEWIKERIDILQGSPKQAGRVGAIVNYLNTFSSEKNYAMFTLVNLCNLISSADMDNVHTIWRKIENFPTPPHSLIKKPPPVEQITKALALTELNKETVDLCKFDWGRDKDLVKNLYIQIFNIPNGIKFDIPIVRNGNYQGTDLKDFTIAILGSMMYIDETDPLFNDFFRNFYATLTYPDINSQRVLFPDDNGKKYASNMVGSAYKILFLSTMISNIEKSTDLDLKRNGKHIQFYERFTNKREEEMKKLLQLKNDYLSVSNQDVSTFYLFIMLFHFFVNQINPEIANTLLTEFSNAEKDPQIKQLFQQGTPLYTTYLQLTSPEDIANNRLSNVENATVLFYVDSAQYLDFFPEWNPDIPDEKDTETTNKAKGMAVGTVGLLKLYDDPSEYIEFGEVGRMIGKGPLIKEIKEISDQGNKELCDRIIQKEWMKKNRGGPFTDISQFDEEELSKIIIEIDKQKDIGMLVSYLREYPSSQDMIVSFFSVKDPSINITRENVVEKLNTLRPSELEEIISAINGIEDMDDETLEKEAVDTLSTFSGKTDQSSQSFNPQSERDVASSLVDLQKSKGGKSKKNKKGNKTRRKREKKHKSSVKSKRAKKTIKRKAKYLLL